MKGSAGRMKDRFLIVWLAVGFCALFWFLESAMHVFVFQGGNILGELFYPNSNELLTRSLVVGLFLVFGMCTQFITNRRKEAEEELRESREQLDFQSMLLNKIQDRVTATDLEGNIVYVNDAEVQSSKRSREELLGQSVRVYGEDPSRGATQEQIIESTLKNGAWRGEIVNVASDGTETIMDCRTRLIRDRDNNPAGMVGISTDMTDQKRAQEALRESEEKYRALFENANDAIFVIQDGMMKFPNPKTEVLFGYSGQEIVQRHFADFIHPEDREMVLEIQRKTLEGEEPRSTYSFKMFNRAGEVLWVQVNTVVISWESRPATLNFVRDISEQMQLQDRFQEAQRMESIGTLAGGIAHDFNNLLMSIQGNASLMMLEKKSNDPDYESLRNIEQCVREGAGLTRQLLGFARGGKYEMKTTDLNELIKTQNRIFSQTRKEIRIHGTYEKGLWSVEADQSQLQQVLMNLYVNAWQAMPGGGYLYTVTENVVLDEDSVRPFGLPPGRYIKLAVSDTGVGMDEKTRERIFEPFFTTREMGRGTGLGLASVYGIVKNHGGFINVSSKKGEGSTFSIYLPASEKDVVEEPKPSKKIIKGEGTILLVDDEERVLGIGERLLKKLGYGVLSAESGKEAVEIYKKGRENIDLVLLDMIMPGMNGGETYDRLKEINPDIKVLLVSGYTMNGRAKEILERGCNGFIQKPFDIKDISQKIRETLDEG